MISFKGNFPNFLFHDTSVLPGVFGCIESLPTVDDGPVLAGQSDEAHHLLVVDLAVDGPAEGLLVQRISHTQLTGLGYELL